MISISFCTPTQVKLRTCHLLWDLTHLDSDKLPTAVIPSRADLHFLDHMVLLSTMFMEREAVTWELLVHMCVAQCS